MGKMLRIIKQSGPEYPGKSEKSYRKESSCLWSCQFKLYNPIYTCSLKKNTSYVKNSHQIPQTFYHSRLLFLFVLSLFCIRNYRINAFSVVL